MGLHLVRMARAAVRRLPWPKRVSVPTLSHHLRVLREAGMTSTRVDGKHRYVSLRATDLEARFPCALASILAAAPTASAATSDSRTVPTNRS